MAGHATGELTNVFGDVGDRSLPNELVSRIGAMALKDGTTDRVDA